MSTPPYAQALFLLAIFCSGAAGLMYETLWVRLLGFVFGTTALATSTVLAAFFAGLGLGGWLLGREADRLRRPFALYAATELSILLGSVIVYAGLHSLGPVYVWLYRAVFAESAPLVTAAQFILSFLLMLLPSVMMGATLPIITRCYGVRSGAFSQGAGLLYAVNTLGGAVGLAAVGFALVELIGIRASYGVAAALNIAAALLALLVQRWIPAKVSGAPSSASVIDGASASDRGAVLPPRAVYLLTFSFGFIAIGLEVLWIRLWSFISLHSDSIKIGFAPAEFSSTYVFSGILLLVLSGISLGGLLVRRLPRSPLAALQALALVQLGQGIWVLLTTQAERVLYLDALWAKLLEMGIIILPAAVTMGLTFPLLAHIHVRRDNSLAAAYGAYYAVNSIGCALGSLGAGLVVLPWLGTYRSLLLFGLVSLALGGMLLLSARRQVTVRQSRRVAAVALGLAGAGVYVAIVSSQPVSPVRGHDVLFEEDNEVAHTLVLGRRANRLLIMNNNAQAGSSDYETGFGARTISIPAALIGHPPTDILLIAVGVGNSWIAAQRYDAHITAVDINPAVFRAMRVMHPPAIVEQLAGPRNHPVVADGRNYLFLSDRLYDIINIDPGPPITQPGMVNLHTREFYELVKAHLKPRGVMYMRLSQTVDNEVFYRMLVRSIAEVFPEVTLWSFEDGVDVIAAAWEFRTVTNRNDLIDPRVFGEMDDWFLMGRNEVKRYVEGYPPVTDDRPRLEYFLLTRLRGSWPDGTPYEVDEKRNRRFLLANRVPMKWYLREIDARER